MASRHGPRTRRVAKIIVDVVHECCDSTWARATADAGRIPGAFKTTFMRGLLLRVCAMRLRLKDLDQPNGRDALVAIAKSMTPPEIQKLADDNSKVLGARWAGIFCDAHAQLFPVRGEPECPSHVHLLAEETRRRNMQRSI